MNGWLDAAWHCHQIKHQHKNWQHSSNLKSSCVYVLHSFHVAIFKVDSMSCVTPIFSSIFEWEYFHTEYSKIQLFKIIWSDYLKVSIIQYIREMYLRFYCIFLSNLRKYNKIWKLKPSWHQISITKPINIFSNLFSYILWKMFVIYIKHFIFKIAIFLKKII